MQYAETLAEIQQEKEALEVELMQSVSKILSDWQDKTGLAIHGISIDLSDVQSLGDKPKSIVRDCNVDIEYEGY